MELGVCRAEVMETAEPGWVVDIKATLTLSLMAALMGHDTVLNAQILSVVPSTFPFRVRLRLGFGFRLGFAMTDKSLGSGELS